MHRYSWYIISYLKLVPSSSLAWQPPMDPALLQTISLKHISIFSNILLDRLLNFGYWQVWNLCFSRCVIQSSHLGLPQILIPTVLWLNISTVTELLILVLEIWLQNSFDISFPRYLVHMLTLVNKYFIDRNFFCL